MLTAVFSCLVLSVLLWWHFTQSDEAGWWDTASGCCLCVTVWCCSLDPCCWLQLCHADPPQLLHSLQPALVTLWYKEIWGAELSPKSSGTTLSVYSSLHWELSLSQIQHFFTSDETNTLSLQNFCLCYVQDTSPKAIMPYCTNKVIELCWKKTFYNPFKHWQDLQTYKITSEIVTIHSTK